MAVAIWVVLSYNKLVAMRDRLYEAWARVELLFEKRRVLVMRLSDRIRQHMPTEAANLELCVKRSDNAYGAHHAWQVEPLLMKAFTQTLTRARQHPEFASSPDFDDMDTGSAKVDNQIQKAAKLYNKEVKAHNERVEKQPLKLVAVPLGFTKADYFGNPKKKQTSQSQGLRAKA